MSSPLVHTAHLEVLPAFADRFEKRLAQHADASRREPGCLKFDIHRNVEQPTRFLLYEVYSDEEALSAHRASEHFKAFRKDIDEWVVDRQWWFWRKVNA